MTIEIDCQTINTKFTTKFKGLTPSCLCFMRYGPLLVVLSLGDINNMTLSQFILSTREFYQIFQIKSSTRNQKENQTFRASAETCLLIQNNACSIRYLYATDAPHTNLKKILHHSINIKQRKLKYQ
jgi:hypothetical protein